ncbi:MAG: hypothetical protein MUE78_07355, partial [Ilumatobacteraceae bacterium]|nr:hypothetical protein [Ilumatobacteraceae bacterium]
MARRSLVGVTLLLLLAVGCTSDDEAATETTSEGVSDDAATALNVCQDLVTTTNALADAVNDAVAGIGAKQPEERREAILEGFRA